MMQNNLIVYYTYNYIYIDGIRDTGRRLTCNVSASLLSYCRAHDSKIVYIVPNELIFIVHTSILNIPTHFIVHTLK